MRGPPCAPCGPAAGRAPRGMDSARRIWLHDAMATIPEQYRDLFTKKAFAHLATAGPDGAPQGTPGWVDFYRTPVRFYTAEGRVQVRHLARHPRVALSTPAPGNPYPHV